MSKLLYMGINGSFLIAAILCFRHFFFHQVPKRFLVFLWICTIARLLLPISIPFKHPPIHHWNVETVSDNQQIDVSASYHTPFAGHPLYTGIEKNTIPVKTTAILQLKDVLFILWLTVAILLAIRIIVKHLQCCRLYNMSLPLCEETAAKWLISHHSFRKVALRKSELIKSPLTYGMIRPVILIPSEINLSEEEFLCIMEHEWIHIRRWDILVKYLLYLTVCIYWFHPLVWLMATLLNRDIEMACDEEVVKKYSAKFKKTYALILIRLAEDNQNPIAPVNAYFARHSEIEERIQLIMKTKKYSWKAAALAIGMICCTVTTFTVSAKESPEETTPKAEISQLNSADATDDLSAAAKTSSQTSTDKVLTGEEDTEINSAYSANAAAQKSLNEVATTNNLSATGEQIAKLARESLGAPYMFGGTDLSSGVDHIGFVKAIYAQAGIELPADLYELAANGTEIPMESLCAGDVIIYSDADGDEKFFHAAIYDGNGQVIHASNMKDGVKASDLNYRDISMAVRILN